MEKSKRVDAMKKMFLSITDPDERAKAKRITDRAVRKTEKMSDTGL